MKTLIVYYSLQGNTEYAAKRIAANIGADTLRLYSKKAYKDKGFAKFLSGGRSAIKEETPDLEDYEINLSEYDRVIFGFPVWASNIAPPLRSFIAEHREELTEKELAAFATQGGSGAPKALGKLKNALGIDAFAAEAVFIEPKAQQSEETDAAIDAAFTA